MGGAKKASTLQWSDSLQLLEVGIFKIVQTLMHIKIGPKSFSVNPF